MGWLLHQIKIRPPRCHCFWLTRPLSFLQSARSSPGGCELPWARLEGNHHASSSFMCLDAGRRAKYDWFRLHPQSSDYRVNVYVQQTDCELKGAVRGLHTVWGVRKAGVVRPTCKYLLFTEYLSCTMHFTHIISSHSHQNDMRWGQLFPTYSKFTLCHLLLRKDLTLASVLANWKKFSVLGKWRKFSFLGKKARSKTAFSIGFAGSSFGGSLHSKQPE